MKNPASEKILAYWAQLRGSDAAPLKSDVDPVALRRFLPHLFILAGEDDGRLDFRLAGTQICDLFGQELKGECFASLWFSDDGGRALDIADTVIAIERPAEISAALYRLGEIIPYEILLMPMRSSADGASDRILGALLPRSGQAVRTGILAEGLIFEDWSFLDEEPFAEEIDQDEEWTPANAAAKLLRMLPFGLSPGR